MSDVGTLEGQFPWIKWRDPVMVQDSAGLRRYCCRVCIARTGLKESEVKSQPRSLSEFDTHFREHTMSGVEA